MIGGEIFRGIVFRNYPTRKRAEHAVKIMYLLKLLCG